MPRFTAFYTDFPWPDVDVEREILSGVDCDIVVSPSNKEETLIQGARQADPDVILTCWAPTTRHVIDAAPKCRHVARTGIGLDNIDVAHCTAKGIIVTNVPDYCVQEVAEHAIAMVFALARKIAYCHAATKRGEYDLVDAQPIYRVSGMTLGVVGLGKTGALAAQKALGLGMRVIGTNRSGAAPQGVRWVPLEELLRESDVVSLHCPLSDETREIIGRRTLALMKPTAFLINTSRGGLVDHDALAEALAEGKLAGAGLDVQVPEPPGLASPPYNDPRVIVTPHTAFCSPQAIRELRERVARQVAAYLRGETPENLVNPEAIADR